MIDLLATCAMMWLGATAAAVAVILGLTRSGRDAALRKRRAR